LRLKNWNKNSETFAPAPADAPAPRWPIPKGIEVNAGGLAIFAKDGEAAAIPIPAVPVTIASVKDGTELTLDAFTPPAAVLGGLTFDTALLHVAPSQVLVPVLNGADVVRVSSPHDLVAGDVMAWKSGTSIRFAKVLEADTGALRLQLASGVTEHPGGNTALFRAAPITFAQFTANGSEWRLPSDMPRSGDFRVTFAGTDGQLRMGLAEADLAIQKHDAGYDRLGAPELGGTRQIWFADPGKDKPAATVRTNPPAKTLEFDGKPPALASGDLVILQTASGYAANRIARIENDAEGYRLVFAADIGKAAVTAMHGVFAATRPTGHHIDPTPIT
jgi:hypothetical protein